MNNHRNRNYGFLEGRLNFVGKNIQKIREEQKMSRQDLSDKLMILGIDVSHQSIYDIETGARTIVDYELCAIAKVLKISTDTLLTDFKEYLDNI